MGPFGDEPRELEGMGPLALLARVLDPMQAHILQGRLQAEGIPVFVADAQLVQTNSLWTFALGGVRVMVPRHLLARAHEVMNRPQRRALRPRRGRSARRRS